MLVIFLSTYLDKNICFNVGQLYAVTMVHGRLLKVFVVMLIIASSGILFSNCVIFLNQWLVIH